MAFVNQPKQHTYDLVLVGSSFASGFFLYEYLKTAPENASILVLERGNRNPHQWQLENQKNSDIDWFNTYIHEGLSHKDWMFTIGFGGSSNCWTGCCPRQLENDFRMKSKYGVGRDWPISYADLEPFYAEVENFMGMSGTDEWSMTPRSTKYPLPPHRLTDPEAALMDHYKGFYYPQSTARPSRTFKNRHAEVENFMGMSGTDEWSMTPRSTKYPLPPHRLTDPEAALMDHYKGFYYPQSTARPSRTFKNRPRCCASGICRLCPIDSVFTIQNSMMDIFEDPRVDVITGAHVDRLETNNNVVTGAVYKKDGKEITVKGELFGLGANGIFNPYIMQKSGFEHEFLGRRIHEQVSTWAGFDLKGMKNYQGSTIITGQGFMWYDGDHRKEYGACMTEFNNKIRKLRVEKDRWNERMYIQCSHRRSL